MFFSRKKKLQKDREAGLTFNWRGSRGYQLGKVLSFVVSVLLFIFAVYALKVEDVQSSMTQKREASVMVIDQEDPSNHALMMMVEQQSPFPPRWDPAYDQDVLNRMDDGVEELMGGETAYDPELLPMPEEATKRYLLSNVKSSDGLFYQRSFERVKSDTSVKDVSQRELLRNVSILENSSLSSRLECLYHPLPDGLVSESAYGQSYEFIVGLDMNGEVLSCLPVTGGAMDVIKPSDSQRALASWLSNLSYKASESNKVAVGMIELQIEAIRKTGE